jgi:hypothetical protein
MMQCSSMRSALSRQIPDRPIAPGNAFFVGIVCCEIKRSTQRDFGVTKCTESPEALGIASQGSGLRLCVSSRFSIRHKAARFVDRLSK